MEKRFLLAVVLSFMVLYVWAALRPKPPSSPSLSEYSQPIDNKEVIKEPSLEFSEPIDKIKPEGTIFEQKPELVTLESEKLIVTFSNIGGSIDNVVLKQYETSLPLTDIGGIEGYSNALFTLTMQGDNVIIYSFENDKLSIVKTYNISEEEYTINLQIRIDNKSDMSKLNDIGIKSFVIDISRLDKNQENGNFYKRDRALFEYVLYSEEGMKRKNNAYKFSSKDNEKAEVPLNWIGFRNRYFCAIVKPDFEATGYTVKSIDEEKLSIDIDAQNVNLQRRGRVGFSSTIFIGPEEWRILKKYKAGFEKIKKYYKFWLFDGIALFIDRFMHLIHRIIPNWGVCIIITSVLIYFSMYPLTLRGMSSMKRLQALQPEMARIKEKNKNNPQKMNQEMIEFYKKHKINPLGGCLPLLLQMPVFIGLYQVLWRSVSFKGAGFLWIDDLSQPDRLVVFPFKLPFIGNELNLLPIIMMLIMFVQTKLQAKNMTITDPNQATQQKMMGAIMPVVLGVIFYKFASGLTLYFTMFYVFSTFTQWKIASTKKAA